MHVQFYVVHHCWTDCADGLQQEWNALDLLFQPHSQCFLLKLFLSFTL